MRTPLSRPWAWDEPPVRAISAGQPKPEFRPGGAWADCSGRHAYSTPGTTRQEPRAACTAPATPPVRLARTATTT